MEISTLFLLYIKEQRDRIVHYLRDPSPELIMDWNSSASAHKHVQLYNKEHGPPSYRTMQVNAHMYHDTNICIINEPVFNTSTGVDIASDLWRPRLQPSQAPVSIIKRSDFIVFSESKD
jgi:hypothetical protein